MGVGCRRDLVESGLRARERGDARQAAAYFSEAVAQNPSDPSAQANLGLMLLDAGRTNEAVAALRQAADLAPDDPRPLEFLAAVAAAAGQWPRAVEHLNVAARRDPRSPRVLTALAAAELETTGPQRARTLLEQALGLAPNYSPALYNLAILHRDWLASPAEARPLFQRYVRVSQDTQHVALARAALASPTLAERAVPPPSPTPPVAVKAEATTAPPVKHHPQAAEDYNRGVRNQMSGNLDQALEDYSRALQNDPTMANAHYNLGLVFRSKGDAVKARAAFQQTLAYAPDMTDARYMLALALLDLHDAVAAEAELNALIKKTPQYASAHHALGQIYKDKPATVELARREFTRYLELAPDGPSAQEARSWLKYHPQTSHGRSER